MRKLVRKDKDYYTWAMQTAESLRHLGMVEVAEDLEEMARSAANELLSHLTVLHTHRLKWIHQPDHRSRSWANSVENAQNQIKYVLRENPGLKNPQKLKELHGRAFKSAKLQVSSETGFPKSRLTSPQPSHEIAMGPLNPPLRPTRGTLRA